ncbi:uncharacterized protein GGS22DRAFT_187235 [Annulohypoxylon maeteangense]|uniref:uncharacterized protein n=1 Tax=Annulohypoxylon maeteangense TaxID=1927788 RepID=UPI002007CC60|nr:uncharacterized protein GGS22DRAFT_187235 [Annulohypoxylon maeteangense]KAI0886004.1 hypothetical protein GGS22DRAFT_187235 [Annulohypoxylon maeteangense]
MAEPLSEIDINLDTEIIKEWHSIVTLVVFVITNIIVLFPFHIPIPFPRPFENAILNGLSKMRVIGPREDRSQDESCTIAVSDEEQQQEETGYWVKLRFPMNFVTAPLIADLFLLAIQAIGRAEVYGGTIGANNISPIDIMAFFITLAYIAISIDASGLIRYLAFKVLQKGGRFGHRLFFYLYAFFFSLGTFIGNDPIILSGTAFLAYMTRVSSNIVHPRAWIFAQFAIANIASAILVSSNPTNLVLAGAFDIRFIYYTANMIVPVVVTAIVLFPFLLYIVFADESLIPLSIQMHELSEEAKARKPVNPNIPNARGNAEEEENDPANGEQAKLLSLEEIMNPFLDKGGAGFGAIIMAATLITLLAINAASQTSNEHPVFYVTLPAAFVMFCWDITFGWLHRKETRKIARDGRREVERARLTRQLEEMERMGLSENKELKPQNDTISHQHQPDSTAPNPENPKSNDNDVDTRSGKLNASAENENTIGTNTDVTTSSNDDKVQDARPSTSAKSTLYEKQDTARNDSFKPSDRGVILSTDSRGRNRRASFERQVDAEKQAQYSVTIHSDRGKATLVSLLADSYRWSQETFPTATAVAGHLPYALVPFAFSMFVLVQALVTKGWVPVFAYGWDHWVEKTGTVGSVGGMGFLSVLLCNFAGTNIGTTILLSRVIQAWQKIHEASGVPISDRTFWAAVYSMALGVNFGAFSTAFSASLAGLLWRDILARKHIHVKPADFARVNLPIITIAMVVGCTILIGEVYIMRPTTPYEK